MDDTNIVFGILMVVQSASVLAAILNLIRSKENLKLLVYNLFCLLVSYSIFKLSEYFELIFPGIIVILILTLISMHYTWKKLYSEIAPEKSE